MNARLLFALFLFAAVAAKPPVSRAQPSCANFFSGKWTTDDPNLSEMQISQNGCDFDGSFEGHPAGGHYEHKIHGKVNDGGWSNTFEIKRTDTGNHCQTTLFGNMVFLWKQGSSHEIDTNKFNYFITGTSGDCGLRKNFTENRVWARCPATGCPDYE
jgi:hypothetical protein